MNGLYTVYIDNKIMRDTVSATYDGETERLGDSSTDLLYFCPFSLSRSVVQSIVRKVF